MNKNEIRQRNLVLRKNLDVNSASCRIVSKIRNSLFYKKANHILIYYPMKFEISLLALLEDNKNFYLPKVLGDNLLIYPYTNELSKSSFGIMEPKDGNCADVSLIDLVFTPALSIDKSLNRVGYGKGFYDRLFSNPSFRAFKVGVIYKELLVDKIEADEFDKKLDFMICN